MNVVNITITGRNLAESAFDRAERSMTKLFLGTAMSRKELQQHGVEAVKWTGLMTGAGTAATGAAGAIGVGLVGAIAGVGIAAAAQAPKVKAAFTGLTTEVKSSMTALSAPIQNVLVGLSGTFLKTFDSLKPTIQSLFTSVAPVVGSVGQALSGAFAGVVKALPGLLDKVMPLVNVFVDQLGPTVQSFVQALTNILGPASGAGEALRSIFQIIQVVAPFLGTVVGLFVQLGAQVLPVLLPVLQQLAQILASSLAKALPDIGRAVQALLPALGTMFGAVAQAVLALSPLLPPLAEAFAQVIEAVAPLIPQLVSYLTPVLVLLAPIFARLIQAIVPLIPPVLQLLSAFLPIAPVLANMAVTVVRALLPALVPFLNLVAQLAVKFSGSLQKALIDALPALVSLAKSFGDLLIAVMPLLPPLVQLLTATLPLISVFAQLAAGLANILVPIIRDVFVPVLQFMVTTVTTVVKAVVGAVSWLFKHWSDVLGDIWRATVFVWALVTGAIKNAIGVIGRFFTDTIPDWYRKGVDLIKGLLNGAQSILKGIARWLGDHIAAPIGNFFTKTLGGAGAWLFNHGKDLINGLLGGAWEILKNVGRWIKDHVYEPIVKAIKKIFGISSPSTVMAGLGGHMIEGLLKGLIFSAKNIPAVLKKVFGGALGLAKDFILNLLGLGGPMAGSFSGAISGAIQQYAKALLDAKGWGDQWSSFNALVMGESGWNPKATNPSSGAFGIPQALPASKLDAYGNRNDPGVQLRWMVDYIQSVYGNPANAYSKWLSRSPHWYDKGGWLQPGLTLAMNATGRPERVLAPGEGAGMQPIIVEIHQHTDGSQMGRAVVEGVRYEVRLRGGNVQTVLGTG